MSYDPSQQQQGAPPHGQPYPAAPGYGGYPQAERRSNGLAIAGMVCGIVGLLIANFILGPLAIIFGGIGLSRANKGASGKGMAISGIVLGIADIVVYVIILVAVANHGGFVA